MSTDRPLAPLFQAHRLAIIGASDRNHYAVKNLQNMGFDLSRIVRINPSRPEVFGLKAYPSILELPGEIPFAVIDVNNKAVASVVEDAGKKGVKAGVIFARNDRYRTPCSQITPNLAEALVCRLDSGFT